MAARFLTYLDPNADRFTFQFFGDGPDEHAEIFHGTIDQVWPKVLALNTPARRVAAFVTVNETDFGGRRTKNVLRPRALFVDADRSKQVKTCIHAIEAYNAVPSLVVKSGRGLHCYWLSGDIPRHEFSTLQKALIERLGTDANVHDLPRVMRLPGTLHLKEESRPRLVTLCKAATPPRRWNLCELVGAFGLSRVEPTPADNVVPFKAPEWALTQRPAPQFAHLPIESLAAGLAPNVEEIRSVVEAIPPAAIASEPDWMKLARGLASVAAIFKDLAAPLWEILDAASRRAPGYNQEDNRRRFLRYINEALDCENPITLASVYHLASMHGWRGSHPIGSIGDPGTSGAQGPSSNWTGPTGSAGPSFRAVHISSLPAVPPKRQWLHGTDLIRGAVTVLVAPGGRAKSTWLLTCALACASGRRLLGAHVFGGPLRVLCLSTEDALPEMALRLRAAMKHYGLADADVPGFTSLGQIAGVCRCSAQRETEPSLIGGARMRWARS
jgi:hypothetical protein